MWINEKKKTEVKLTLLFAILLLLTFWLPVIFLSGCNGSSSGNGNNNGHKDVSVDSRSDVLADVGTDTSGDTNVNEDSSDGMSKEEFCDFCRKKGLNCPETMPDGAGSLSKEDCIDPNKPGTLKVTAETTADSPSVFINGEDSGKDAPAEFKKKPGKYRVRLKADGYLMRVDLMKKKPEKVKVNAGKKKKVKIAMYRDGRGTWQNMNKPDRKYVVKMHTKSSEGSTECPEDVYLKNVEGASRSYCLHPDNTFNLCSKEKRCRNSWFKGKFLNNKKYRFARCVGSGCYPPKKFKKISE